MIIHKTYKFKLKPTKAQVSLFWQYAGACRWVYNHCLTERIETYQATGKSPSAYDQMKRLTLLKKQAETAWLKAMPAQVLQQAILDLDAAYENFFAMRARYPKFKNRRSRPAFRYPQSVKVNDNRIYLPKVGWVKFFKSQDIEGKIKHATIFHRASGWYVAISTEVELALKEPVAPTATNSIGIDLGLSHFAVLSDGRRVHNPRYYQEAQKKLAKAQRVLARRQQGSRRWQMQKQKVAKLCEKVANARQDFLHKLSHQLLIEYEVIITENLDLEALARGFLAKNAQDAGWGEFLRQLNYKSV
ncbi:MAG TPA: transposase [Chloroflexota bacterium]|nr:transposase [Chloroflexota bacterium]HUM68455.1 transposase [Chloroflexota bacterium]